MGAVSLEFFAAANDCAVLVACQPKRGVTSIQRKTIAQSEVPNLPVSPELRHVDLAAFLRLQVDEMYFVRGAIIPDELA